MTETMSIDPEKIAPDEIVPWLAYLADEGGTLGEGDLAEALGTDRVGARDAVIRGRDIAQRVRDARVARVKAEVAAERARVAAEIGAPLNARREPYRQALPAVRALFSDGKQRTIAEVATALGLTHDAAMQRLYRCDDVERVGRGVWALKATVTP